MTNKYALFNTVFILGILFSACTEEPVQSPSSIIDTTSHHFTILRIDTLGTEFSIVNGVDIVSENDIWVAGNFTEKDSNNEIIRNKNLAHWNGHQWTLKSVPMLGYNNTGPDPEELGAVKVFDDSTIFVVTMHNSSVAWWDGKRWTSTYVVGYAVSPNLWARSKSEIYFAAREARASYWDGNSFHKIDMGLTNPPFTDIWGDENSVYMVGYGVGGSEGTETIMMSGNQGQWSINNRYDFLTIDEKAQNYVGANRSVFRKNSRSKLWMFGGAYNGDVFEIQSLNPFAAKKVFTVKEEFYPLMIRGTADNDLYLVSMKDGEFIHFNGASWRRYSPLIPAMHVYNFNVKNNLFAIVGTPSNSIIGSAIIIIGKHDY